MPVAQIWLRFANRAGKGAIAPVKRLSARVIGAEADVPEAPAPTPRAVKKALRRVKSRS
jgi:hypothetical protein